MQQIVRNGQNGAQFSISLRRSFFSSRPKMSVRWALRGASLDLVGSWRLIDAVIEHGGPPTGSSYSVLKAIRFQHFFSAAISSVPPGMFSYRLSRLFQQKGKRAASFGHHQHPPPLAPGRRAFDRVLYQKLKS